MLITNLADGADYQRRGQEEIAEWARTSTFDLGPVGESSFGQFRGSGLNILKMRPDIFANVRPDGIDARLMGGIVGFNPVDGSDVDTHVMVLDHDWARVFPGADADDAVVSFPFPHFFLEMHLGGRIVLLQIISRGAAGHNGLNIRYYVESPVGAWLTVDDETPNYLRFRDAVLRHVYGAMTALEVGVVEPGEKIVRAPKLNVRPALRTPGFSWHRLRVPHKHAQRSSAGPYQGVVALHWRRGHWRQGTVRSWVKAHLVGNPELGFIDKEYRIRPAKQGVNND